MANQKPIGVLDSGVGGLTVLKELKKALPNESFIYLGDSGRAPYGPRPVEEILLFTEQMIDRLLESDVKAVVLACNTITVNCLPALQQKYMIPIIGMNLAAEAVNQLSEKRSVAILGTAATIAAGKHLEALQGVDTDLRAYPIPCYDFAALVEAGHIGDSQAMSAVSQYLGDVRGEVDVVVLGCTHYPFLAKDIEVFMGDTATIIDPADLTAKDTAEVLKNHDMLSGAKEEGTITIYFTGDLCQPKALAVKTLASPYTLHSTHWH